MQAADLVLYDRLISPEILSLVSPSAAMLYVGKESGLHTRPQEQIHELLLQFAQSGRTVVRLKGGDPTVFGRGGEEMEYLEAQGVRVRIVGVTAAAGIAADLGVRSPTAISPTPSTSSPATQVGVHDALG